MHISKKQVSIGEKEFQVITLINDNGMKVECLSLGGIITKIIVPDKVGNMENVVVGFKDLETYLENPPYFGAIIGRTGGRIHKGQVEIKGKTYELTINNNANTLHGGDAGFHKKIWDSKLEEEKDYVRVILSCTSADGEAGYPGNLDVSVSYTLNDENELILNYKASTDKDTVVNLTNHSYFNLSGNIKAKVLEHMMYIDSDKVCQLDEESIPTGEWIDVKDTTTFDFNEPKVIGKEIDAKETDLQSGYDHPWVLKKSSDIDAYYHDPVSGRLMTIKTDEKAVVVYAMNFADPLMLYNDKIGSPRYGICFETQSLPIGYNQCYKEDSILEVGKKYNKRTVFKFGTKA
ncbi:MAG: aldose epimerase family protein [Cellulosilyticaceae bacterium]